MKVGIMLPAAADGEQWTRWPAVAELARRLEAGGVDSLWVADHFFHREENGTEHGLHEAWTLLVAVAAITERVEIGPLVLATSFRNPGLTAKMAATANEVAGGRLILGLGCGWHEPEYTAFGFPFDHRVGRFEEALGVIVPLLRGERVTLDARWTQVDDAVLVPPPSPAPPPILIAAKGDRMLRLTARWADQSQMAWFGRPDDRFRERRDRLLAACEAEGRDPATLVQTVGLELGGDDDDRPAGWREIALDPSAIGDALGEWAAEGVDHVQLVVVGAADEGYDTAVEGLGRR
jgi:alkanesulfonate monooxygenase SsuD/methylene tetrahydromethanopterin reductase-like flavin-dependent oxidoreductase (luciferase family)